MQACQQHWVTPNSRALQNASSFQACLSSPDHYFIARWMLSRCCQNAHTFPQRWKTNRGNLFPQIRYWSRIVCWASDIFSEKWMSNALFLFSIFTFFVIKEVQMEDGKYVFCALLMEHVNSFGHDILAVISSLWRDYVWCVLLTSCLSLQWSQLLPQTPPKTIFFSILLSHLDAWESQLTGCRHGALYNKERMSEQNK